MRTIQLKENGTITTYYVATDTPLPGSLTGTRVQNGARPIDNRLWVSPGRAPEGFNDIAYVSYHLGLLTVTDPKPVGGIRYEIGNPQEFLDHWADHIRATYTVESGRNTATFENWDTCRRFLSANTSAQLTSIQVP